MACSSRITMVLTISALLAGGSVSGVGRACVPLLGVVATAVSFLHGLSKSGSGDEFGDNA